MSDYLKRLIYLILLCSSEGKRTDKDPYDSPNRNLSPENKLYKIYMI